jgi:hypothetical protein
VKKVARRAQEEWVCDGTGGGQVGMAGRRVGKRELLWCWVLKVFKVFFSYMKVIK